MKIIEGKAGKSLLIQNIIKDKKDSFLIIDGVGINFLEGTRIIDVKTIEDVEEILNEILSGGENFPEEIEFIILELNASSKVKSVFKKWEQRLNKGLILTIQNNDIEENIVYDI